MGRVLSGRALTATSSGRLLWLVEPVVEQLRVPRGEKDHRRELPTCQADWRARRESIRWIRWLDFQMVCLYERERSAVYLPSVAFAFLFDVCGWL